MSTVQHAHGAGIAEQKARNMQTPTTHNGIAAITPAVRAEITEIATLAQKVFRSSQQSERWFTSPKVGLQGRTPIESMKSLDGCRQVKALIVECQ
ncbi:antitoxin Xre/MbcA/ParS toxin-binding domain-containing protein [Polaromonas sp. UC242_47]|uniref:antitoxin Xre/MbcA/ParS toxin-binding domain-containing protein n=1 Tax=Polaromonas sp. UC242_47 TaxID=3374626 RepID=UPI0037AC235F